MNKKLPTHKEERTPSGAIIAEGSVYKGKKHGFWIEYYPSKNILSEELHIRARGFYKDGKKIGIWNEYHYDGALKGYGLYQNNQKTGRWIYFNRQSDVVSITFYNSEEKQVPLLDVVAQKTSRFTNFLKNTFSHQKD